MHLINLLNIIMKGVFPQIKDKTEKVPVFTEKNDNILTNFHFSFFIKKIGICEQKK